MAPVDSRHQLTGVRRFFVVGVSGSGKTTLAREIAYRRQLPHVELDSLWWGPNWTPANQVEYHQRVQDAVAGDDWVVDGNNWTAAQLFIFPRLEVLLWLDPPLYRALWSMVIRTLRQLVFREQLHGGNRQTLRTAFSRQGIVWWTFRTFRKRRRRYNKLKNNPRFSHITVIQLRSRRQVRTLLKTSFDDVTLYLEPVDMSRIDR